MKVPPPKHTQFKKGKSGNPKGRPKDQLGKVMRQLTAEEFAEIANLIIKGSIEDLRKIARDDKQTALKVMIAATAVKIISKGDMSSLDTLLNRLVGKVKDQVSMDVTTKTAVSEEQLIQMAKLIADRKTDEEE